MIELIEIIPFCFLVSVYPVEVIFAPQKSTIVIEVNGASAYSIKETKKKMSGSIASKILSDVEEKGTNEGMLTVECLNSNLSFQFFCL